MRLRDGVAVIHDPRVAIQFARARYISRSTGGSAVRSAAYNGRAAITAERTGEVFHFRHRDAPAHHAVLLPEGAAERFADSGVLWNAAEAAERRRDAQVAREIVLALPADAEVTTEDRIALARSFAARHFVSQGLAVQLDIHAPHEAEAESERANWHAHLLITTRRLEGERFAPKKARDLEPAVRQAGGRALVADGAAWGEVWREHQDRYFREHGLALRVDAPGPVGQEHIGPVRMRRAGSEILARAETIRQANQAAARDPEQVLAALTRHNATFTERDLDRFLDKQLGPETGSRDTIAAVRTAVLGHRDLIALHERESGEAAERFTTRQVRAEERSALAEAVRLGRARSGPVSASPAAAARHARPLRPDQAVAFDRAIGPGGLVLIEGRAGTGKSYTLAAIRDAHERDGRRVVGLAPTNAVAQDLAADGFRESGTVHAALFRLKNGRTAWDRRTVVVVDEAAMLDTRVTGELLAAARQSGAKLILAGDDRQLASIERGGLFSELKARHGAAEITEVTRQRVDWQRQAARDLAEGRFAAAVGAFDKGEAITWTATQDEARQALVAAWQRDTEARPGASRFVFAYTNRDVDALNAELRQVRRARGELAGEDVAFETRHGRADFAVGDRVQFTETDKRRGILNGHVGTITGLDARSGAVTARLDAAHGPGREVTWSAAEFRGFRHGYAGTIYKGQGKTLDHTYLYHTAHWRAAASYVALTRQRESAAVFVARETARDAGQLAWQMARGEVRAASVAWATREEVAAARARAEPGRGAEGEDRFRAKVREAIERRERTAREARVGQEEGRTGARPAPARGSEAAPSPDARLGQRTLDEKLERELRGRPEEKAALKADVARRLADKEAREGRVALSETQRRAASAPAPVLLGREALRRELLALDREGLAQAARADLVNPGFAERRMTVKDVARDLSPLYAAAADRTAALRQDAAEVNAALKHYRDALRDGEKERDRRWRQMGLLGQALHSSGLRPDHVLAANRDMDRMALEELAKLEPRRAALGQTIPEAEKDEAKAFRRVEPQAIVELMRREQRAGLAREIRDERARADVARRLQQERSRGRERGLER